MGSKLKLNDFGNYERILAAMQNGPYLASDVMEVYDLPERFPVGFDTYYAISFEFTPSTCITLKITPKFTNLFHFANANAFWSRFDMVSTKKPIPPYVKSYVKPKCHRTFGHDHTITTIMQIAEGWAIWRTCLILDVYVTKGVLQDIIPAVRHSVHGSTKVPDFRR